jgi:hypothetical protein
MIGGLYGIVRRATKHAMKASYRDTRRGFGSGSKRRGSSGPLSEAEKAFYGRLKRLAPKPRRKRLRPGPY